MKAYYRIQNEYFKNQNLFHRPYVLLIQKTYRQYVYQKRRRILLREKSSKLIQKKWRDYCCVTIAKIVVQKIRDENLVEYYLNIKKLKCTIIIQRVGRGTLYDFILIFLMLPFFHTQIHTHNRAYKK